ncbi:periplasmic heavy metal sensor [Aliidiomarina sp. Khilg15.8]
MLTRGIFKVAIAAAFTLSSATLSAHDHMGEQKDKGSQQSRMMQGDHANMDKNKKRMGNGMMGMSRGMCSMMGGMASGQGMGNGMGSGMGSMMMGKHGAELTEQQQEKLAELHGEQAKQQFMFMQKLQEPRQRLQELMMADEVDTDAVGEAFDKLSDLHKNALLGCLEHKQEMQEIMKQ